MLKKLYRKLFMCKCKEPDYVVKCKKLACKNCGKPAIWLKSQRKDRRDA